MSVLGAIGGLGGSWMLIAGAGALFLSLFIVMGALTGNHVRRRKLAKELAGPGESSVRSQMSSLGTKATQLAERSLANSAGIVRNGE